MPTGGRTYGKGTVQRVEELPNGYAYKYTVPLPLPSGKPIEGRGLTPRHRGQPGACPDGQGYERQLSLRVACWRG